MSKLLAKKKIDIFLFILFFAFSWWLFDKSFGYNTNTHEFRIARHQIGDFGLHISLIRSFSWGNNFPVESPFFPGVPLPYHYYFDLFAGILVKIGLPIHVAFNGLSIIAFTCLLWFVYKLPQIIFRQGRMTGILSVVLFIFHSSMSFVDFLKNKSFSASFIKDLWFLPDYIHKGPFDGSIISIYFTINVFLNQRHLVAALALGLGLLYFLLQKLTLGKNISIRSIVLMGIILGISSRIHTLVFLSNMIIISLLLISFKRKKLLFPFLIPACLLFIPQVFAISLQQQHKLIHLGFLSKQPLMIQNFMNFWFMNLGIALALIPIGFFLSHAKQKIIFLSFFPLFFIGNILQLSFKVDHNHSLFNYFILLSNFYIAFVLIKLWQQKSLGKILALTLFFLLTFSGFIDLFVVKNDFQLIVKDAPGNKFMDWIKNHTGKKDIFLARKEILDPITFSGRKNYLGHIYDMGYDTEPREKTVKSIFEAQNKEILTIARQKRIRYIALPNSNVLDFNYTIDREFFKKTLKAVYEDNQVTVFQL